VYNGVMKMTEGQNHKAADSSSVYEFRVSRLPYSVLSILIFFTSIGLGTLIGINVTHYSDAESLASALALCAGVILIILSVGRYHDIGLSGAWSLLLFHPLIVLFAWLYLVVTPSAEDSR